MKMQALIVVLAVLYWGLASFGQSVVLGHGPCRAGASDEPILVAAADPAVAADPVCAPGE